MDRRAQFFPLEWPFLAALFAALLVVVALVQIGILQYVYERLGIAPGTVFAILAFELLGSYVNLPLAWLRSSPAVEARRIVVYGVPYVVPAVVRPRATLLAVNVGGAVIPTALSVYLILHAGVGASALAATVVVTAGVRLVARPVTGVGIAVPTLLPPALAALSAMLIAAPSHAAPVAFASGTLGTLLGADVLNLRKVADLGAPIASIGGAGTFDAVFLTGIVAVLLVSTG